MDNASVPMKRIFFVVLMMSWLCLSSGASSSFSAKLEKLIMMYEGTRDPKLPDIEIREQLDDALALPPASLPMTRDIIINKRKLRLYVVNMFGDTLAEFPVCCARNRGPKKKADDCTTPEGTFSIIGVYNSTDWTYKDTNQKCYGPFFIHLRTPGFYGIGIHGTNAPGSIPGRSSHGCIRMHNENIVKLKAMVNKDTKVTILPDDIEDEKRVSDIIRTNATPKSEPIRKPESNDSLLND